MTMRSRAEKFDVDEAMDEFQQSEERPARRTPGRKRDASLPRTTQLNREFIHYKAKRLGHESTIDYIEETLAPRDEVKAWKQAKEKLHAEDNNEAT